MCFVEEENINKRYCHYYFAVVVYSINYYQRMVMYCSKNNNIGYFVLLDAFLPI